MLTSILDGVEFTTMACLNPLLPQNQVQQVKCHYGQAKVEDANLGCPFLPIFSHQKNLGKLTFK